MGAFRGVELDALELAGDQVRVRPWRPDDAEALLAIMAFPSVREALSLPDPVTRDEAQGFVAAAGEGRKAGTGLAGAVVTGTGDLAGSAALRDLEGRCQVEVWTVADDPDHRWAVAALRLLAGWAFAQGVDRVELLCRVTDPDRAGAALAAGFAYEGTARGVPVAASGAAGRRAIADLAQFARLAGDPGAPIAPSFPALDANTRSDGVLALRQLGPDDLDAWIEQETDPLTTGWGFRPEPMSGAAAAATHRRAGLEWLVGNTARLAMHDVASGRFAGSMQVRVSGPPQIGGIGYTVHPSFRGRGYTARALRLLVPWAFGVAGLARLELGAKTANVASQRAAAAAGFEPDGIRRSRLRNPDGSFSDEVRFALVDPRHAGAPDPGAPR